MEYLLVPLPIASRCFLREALYWAAFFRYPIEPAERKYQGFRFDRSYQTEYEAKYPNSFEYLITDDECARAGLPPSPQYRAYIEDDNWVNSDRLAEILQWDGLPDSFRKEIIFDLEEIRLLNIDIRKWQKEYEKYLEVFKASIFVNLREGRLKAYGRHVTYEDEYQKIQNEMDESPWYYEGLDNDDSFLNRSPFDSDWSKYAYNEIPQNLWSNELIDWKSSALTSDGITYCHVYVNVDELFSLYPIPAPDRKITVGVTSGQYTLEDAEALLLIKKRGRPSFEWDKVLNEAKSRVMKGQAPAKLESFVEEMREWYEKVLGAEPPKRSTMLEKLSPIHQAVR